MKSLLAVMFLIAGTPANADDHTPLSFHIENDRIVATGEIDETSLDAFEDILRTHPGLRILELRFIGGSVDDEANLEFGRVVHELGFTTLVRSNGLVASGGTDLFLAGTQRILEPGACVGVHSWAAQDFTANEIPRSDREHQRYLAYYRDIEIEADFYWFTIEAAPADDMHWMSKREARQFGMATKQVPQLGSYRQCDDR